MFLLFGFFPVHHFFLYMCYDIIIMGNNNNNKTTCGVCYNSKNNRRTTCCTQPLCQTCFTKIDKTKTSRRTLLCPFCRRKGLQVLTKEANEKRKQQKQESAEIRKWITNRFGQRVNAWVKDNHLNMSRVLRPSTNRRSRPPPTAQSRDKQAITRGRQSLGSALMQRLPQPLANQIVEGVNRRTLYSIGSEGLAQSNPNLWDSKLRLGLPNNCYEAIHRIYAEEPYERDIQKRRFALLVAFLSDCGLGNVYERMAYYTKLGKLRLHIMSANGADVLLSGTEIPQNRVMDFYADIQALSDFIYKKNLNTGRYECNDEPKVSLRDTFAFLSNTKYTGKVSYKKPLKRKQRNNE